MDPIISLSALLSLAEGKKKKVLKIIAIKATLVALFVFLIFAFGGDFVFKVLGVDINSFKVAGGIILVIMGLEMVIGKSFVEKRDVSDAAVVIGTPLIGGPATITTTIILVKDIGLGITLAAGLLSLVVILFTLLSASYISKYIGKSSLHVISTMMGIVTISWGVQFLVGGLLAFV